MGYEASVKRDFELPTRPFTFITFEEDVKDAPRKMESFRAINKVVNVKGGSKHSIEFLAPNCCSTPKIARTSNFLPDSTRGFSSYSKIRWGGLCKCA